MNARTCELLFTNTFLDSKTVSFREYILGLIDMRKTYQCGFGQCNSVYF